MIIVYLVNFIQEFFVFFVVMFVASSRKMQVNGATDLASKSEIVSDSSNVKLKEEIEDTYQMEIRCPCESSLQAETMIQVFLLCWSLHQP